MEKRNNIKAMVLVVIAIIIVIGVGFIATIGLNFGVEYANHKRFQIRINQGYNLADIRKITNEVYKGRSVQIGDVEIFNDIVSINVKESTDEELELLLEKINEKYAAESTVENINNENIPNIRGRDIVKPYIVPSIIAIIFILIYLGIKYRKLGVIKLLIGFSLDLVILLLLMLSLIAICRIPINQYTIPTVLLISLAYIIMEMVKLEKLVEK